MLFKCKMCGGDLDVIEGKTIAVCESCGSKQTLPRLTDDKKKNMYDRANHFRRNNEYDKAMSIYETILNEDKTDAESYWSLVLCKYGIEYVEDPKTNQRIPTCNRTQYTSVLADENYKAAIEYADSEQKEIYEAEAHEIDAIQKNILEISRKEEPFDIFICYKESDADGKRTPDSVVAQEMYYELTQEGYKVFFSRITLEDKLGTAYEPYIFAALNSAKIMIVVSTKKEYVNAVWVENEWSRFLHMAEKEEDKTLIPAYRDMDPYDLPDEFSHLQALDMSKLGFMQDLLHGIKKIMQEDKEERVVREEVPVNHVPANAAPLLERVFLFLEDGDWESADSYCEKVLDIEPKNARAYLGKLMAELRVSKEEDLSEYADSFDDRNNYQKVLRFADEELRKRVESYATIVNERREQKRLEGIYCRAVSKMEEAGNEEGYKKAAEIFRSVSGYKDADVLAKQCFEQAEECRKALIYHEAIMIADYMTIDYLERAIRELQTISGWRDADEKIKKYQCKVEEIKARQERERIEKERQIELARLAAEKQAKKRKITTAVITIVAVICIAFSCAWIFVIYPTQEYNKGLDLIAEGNFEEGYAVLEKLGDFKDAGEQIKLGKYNQGLGLITAGDFDEGYAVLEEVGDFKDAGEQIKDSQYNRALSYMESSDYEAAYVLFQRLGDYKDCESQMTELEMKEPRLLFKMTKVGEVLKFGSYEQDNDKSNGQEPIEWIVLQKKEGKILLISKKGLVSKSYHRKNNNSTWKNCSLRKWLNHGFINTAFTEEEEKYLVPTEVVYDINDSEMDKVTDQVFLLNDHETDMYFSSYIAKRAKATEYAVAKGAAVFEETGNSYWWVRSPSGCCINSYGGVASDKKALDNGTITVRPAMWVSLKDEM